MRVIVISGSPKGNESLSLNFVKYLEKLNKDIIFEILEIGKYSKVLEKNKDFFISYINAIDRSDLIIWCTPVHTLTVSHSIISFIELINKNKKKINFKNKYATSILTSINFFDTTAEDYLRLISESLSMKYIKGYFINSSEKLTQELKDGFQQYFKNTVYKVKNKYNCEKRFHLHPSKKYPYNPTPYLEQREIELELNAIIITDHKEDSNIEKMIFNFQRYANFNTKIINLNKIDKSINHSFKFDSILKSISGNYEYSSSDINFFENEYTKADLVVWAIDIKNHLFSENWKIFIDKCFYYDYKNLKKNQNFGIFISGEYSNEPVLYKFLNQYISITKKNCMTIITDSDKSNREITKSIKDFTELIENKDFINLKPQKDFYSISSKKILGDFIFNNRHIFDEDNKLAKDLGLYHNSNNSIFFKIKVIIFKILYTNKKLKKSILEKNIENKTNEVKKLSKK